MRKNRQFLFLVILSFAIANKPFYSQDGSLDLSFGTNGIVTTSIGSGIDYGKDVAIQSDGKILVAGYSNNGSDFDFALVRYNDDGSLDNSFGNNGIVITDIESRNDNGRCLIIQNDGKILVGGDSNLDFAVVRYNSDGSLDNSFGSGGKVYFPKFRVDFGHGIELQSDGKIIIAGAADISNYFAFALVRYNSDGTLDTSFGTNGIVTTFFGFFSDGGRCVKIQSDGKIVVAGYTSDGWFNFAMIRYNTDGSLDTSFGTNGIIELNFESFDDDEAQSIEIQPDGKIVVGGYSAGDFLITRFNADGSQDISFGTNGFVITSIGSGTDEGKSVLIQPDGKIVLAGFSRIGSNDDFAVVRYNSDGSLDNSFDSDGKVTTAIGTNNDQAYGIALQNDGKIVVAGYSAISSSNYDFAIVRYNNPSVLPVELTTFTAEINSIGVELNWETATEVNNFGFEVERNASTSLSMSVIPSGDKGWEKLGFVEGHGNSNSPKYYSFTDNTVTSGKYSYRLKQIDIDGTFEYSDVIEVEVLPTKYELFQNYPNPFNPSTNIKFSLPEDAKVNINIYNVLGERVASVLSEELKAGFHQIDFNSNSAGYQLSSGVYLYTIESKNFSQVKKMILMK
ncbi:MAG: T9SS type A sorting domain-containing protein [Ignavibacteriae bacterium]|nr:T9SS type A sorting domain-containing protein [Ignavibacteriota bacterium]